jgi:hypothetical protein
LGSAFVRKITDEKCTAEEIWRRRRGGGRRGRGRVEGFGAEESVGEFGGLRGLEESVEGGGVHGVF